MKNILAVTTVVISLAAGVAFAQMGGQQSQQMMGGQMSQEMMRDMTGMMNHMVEMMQMMSHTMGHKTVTEHMKMTEMAGMMEEMSVMMHTMAQNMTKGQMTPADTKKLRAQLDAMKKKMEAMGKEGK